MHFQLNFFFHPLLAYSFCKSTCYENVCKTSKYECISNILLQLYQFFKKPEVGDKYGRGRDWNVDLIPKFLMSNGKFVSLKNFFPSLVVLFVLILYPTIIDFKMYTSVINFFKPLISKMHQRLVVGLRSASIEVCLFHKWI